MDIKYSKAATKVINTLPISIRRNMRDRIDGLTKVPPEGDIKAMQGKPGLYRLRVGQYRIIYHYESGILKIDKVGARGDIYK